MSPKVIWVQVDSEGDSLELLFYVVLKLDEVKTSDKREHSFFREDFIIFLHKKLPD